MTQNIVVQKTKLEQMKARLAAEEVRFRIRAQKQQTKNLIELGKLVVKSGFTNLPSETLYGALLSLKDSLGKENSDALLKQWAKIGKVAIEKEKRASIGVIIRFTSEQSQEVKTHLKGHGLKWNSLRKEWYGHVQDLDQLRNGIGEAEHAIDLIPGD